MKKIFNRVEPTMSEVQDLIYIINNMVDDIDVKKSLIEDNIGIIVKETLKYKQGSGCGVISLDGQIIVYFDTSDLSSHLFKRLNTQSDILNCVNMMLPGSYALSLRDGLLITLNEFNTYTFVDIESGMYISSKKVKSYNNKMTFNIANVVYEHEDNLEKNIRICINPYAIVGDYVDSEDFKRLLYSEDGTSKSEEYDIFKKGNLILFLGAVKHYLVRADHYIKIRELSDSALKSDEFLSSDRNNDFDLNNFLETVKSIRISDEFLSSDRDNDFYLNNFLETVKSIRISDDELFQVLSTIEKLSKLVEEIEKQKSSYEAILDEATVKEKEELNKLRALFERH